MKPLLATLTFLLTASAGLAQSCTPYYMVEFCMDGTYWEQANPHEFDRMMFWGDEATHLEVGFMGSLNFEDFTGPNFDALNAVMDNTFNKYPNNIDRFRPLGDDTPAITNTSLYVADGNALVHTLYAINGMMLWIITSENSDTVTQAHIQRHIEAIRSIRAST